MKRSVTLAWDTSKSASAKSARHRRWRLSPGGDIRDFRTKMNLDGKPQRQGSWWQRLWKQS